MDKLPREARAFLEQARHADDPTPRERWNADAAVRVALDMHGVRDLPPLPEPRDAPRLDERAARSGHALRAGLAVKLGIGLGAAALLVIGAQGLTALLREDAAPSAPLASSVSPPQPSAAPLALAPARPDPRPRELAPAMQLPPAVQPAPRKAARDASLAAELRWLARVDARIRDGAFERALQLLDNAPGGQGRLQEERHALRVLALCGRGATPHALRERERFLQASPRSVLAARVRATCLGQPVPR